MRYQELIYIQNENDAVRNKDILNVNMSSDICVFEAPSFFMSGATKLDCSGNTGTTYVISTATTIPLTITFTGNTYNFQEDEINVGYQIYKYNNNTNTFTSPDIFSSQNITISGFSDYYKAIVNVPVSGISLDGQYIIKLSFQFSACTTYLNQLGKTIDTLTFLSGDKYGLYDSNLDYFFIAFKGADTPLLTSNGSNTNLTNRLIQDTILPEDGQTVLTINQLYLGDFILTLNGLVLAPDYDFTFTGNVITLSGGTNKDDILTVTYTSGSLNNLKGDNILVNTPIVSGSTDKQGDNLVYFNTGTSKYEVYTTLTPSSGDVILLMLNGLTLSNGIDYYQSSSNPKRIILNGVLVDDDLITIVYFPTITVENGIITNNPNISWSINNPPQLVNGVFSLEVSTGSSFNTLYSSSNQNYVIGVTSYSDYFKVSGETGTKLYYRVKNQKNFVTLCGNVVTDIAYSETVPIIIKTNSINTY